MPGAVERKSPPVADPGNFEEEGGSRASAGNWRDGASEAGADSGSRRDGARTRWERNLCYGVTADLHGNQRADVPGDAFAIGADLLT